MTILQALFFGLVQGLTEFLPVSSSAHLVIAQHLLGFREPLVFFDVVLHLGTLASLFVYFAGDLARLLRDSASGIFYLARGSADRAVPDDQAADRRLTDRRRPLKEIAKIAPHFRWALGILIASLPTAVMGFLFKDWFESLFGSLRAVGSALFGTTLLLGLTRRFQKNERGVESLRYRDFLLIGLFQGMAIAPGLSRSGSTIACALFLGLKREEAFRFSFLLAIPALIGAGLLEAKEGFAGWAWGGTPLAAGFLVSAAAGFLSLFFLSRITRRGKLHRFAWYTAALGLLALCL